MPKTGTPQVVGAGQKTGNAAGRLLGETLEQPFPETGNAAEGKGEKPSVHAGSWQVCCAVRNAQDAPRRCGSEYGILERDSAPLRPCSRSKSKKGVDRAELLDKAIHSQ